MALPLTPPVILRRLAQAVVGRGPWRAAPFAEIAHDRLDYARRGVHRAEEFTGEILRAPGTPAVYGPAHSLLGQIPTWEPVSDGPRYRERGVVLSAPQVLYSLADAGVATTDGVVYCPRTRRAVTETLRCWTRPALAHPFLSAPRYPGPKSLPGRTLSLLTLSGEGFYHLMLEVIPRLHLAADILPHVDQVLANGAPGSMHEKWLALAGVPPEKVIWAHELVHYRCEQLLFAGYPMRDQQPSAWTIEALRDRLAAPKPRAGSPRRRLWISRNDAVVRRVAWEREFVARLPGFEHVELSRWSPREQVALFADCAAVAGPHGAGLAHIAFCPSGTHVFELFPNDRRQPIYHRLAALAGAHYHWATVDFERATCLDELARAIRAPLADLP